MVSSTTVLQVILVSWACVTCAVLASGDRADERKLERTTAAADAGETPAATVTTAPPPSREPDKDVSILKQINKVNDDGSYTFGYEASDGSFKVETRDVAGNVKGMFGFVDEEGRLKRVSYSASNSSGFQAAGTTSSAPAAVHNNSSSSSNSVQQNSSSTPPPPSSSSASVQTIPLPVGKYTATGVKKVLVSKRPVTQVTLDDNETAADRRRREGQDPPPPQLSRNDDGDAPDVYGGGLHGRSSMQSGPVSPVVSALMSELEMAPIRAYRPTPQPPQQQQQQPIDSYDGGSYARQDTISRLAVQEDEEPPQYRPVTVQYRKPQQYQQQQSVLPAVVYQQQQQQQPQPIAAYGPNLAAFRDELMELILSFVQARVSQLVSLTPYGNQPQPQPQPSYPMPYQQPNYYVPSYYQGPRIPVLQSSRQPAGGYVLQQLSANRQSDDDYADAAAPQQSASSSPRVTQTLKDGLIRMLLSTSPRYDPERTGERLSTRAAYRRTTQSTPVRSVQILDDATDSRPVTTETPD